jgi:RNA polymerase sigma factor (sigma-70 family)
MRDAINRARWVESAVERYEGPLLRYAFRISGNLDRARDVVQDVFLRLWEVDPKQIEDRLAAWLYKVCRNRALDIQRKEEHMKPVDLRMLNQSVSSDYRPDQVVEIKETTRNMGQLLSTLPARQQEVIRLKFQNELSYQEISQVTQLTVSNVGYLIHTAIKALRQQMHAAEQQPFPAKDEL